MKIAVMGAGAVGCFFGALLAQAGHDVTLIGRPALVEAVRDGGLLLEHNGERWHVAVFADTRPEAVAGAELVLFCVKSFDTEAAAAAIAPHIGADCSVWSLQNGIDNADRLAHILDRPAVPVAVYAALEAPAAGYVRHKGGGKMVIGPSTRSEEFAGLFAAAGISARVAPDVVGTLWTKLAVNCALNALSALAALPYGRLVGREGVDVLLKGILAECRVVAEAYGVTLPPTLEDTVFGLGTSMAEQYSSTAQDLARGRRTEIDDLNGAILRRAAARGLEAPLNQALWTLVKLREAGPPSSST